MHGPLMLAIVFGGIVLALAIIGSTILMGVKILKGGASRTGQKSQAEEARMIQEIYQGLSRMEIGSIPIEVQEKILRVVEYGTFERVGSSESIEADVRIIAATNADLMALTAEGRFKQDLLDRLSFEVLFLPALRDRQGDIFLLANHFATRMAFELGREEIPRFSGEAIAALESYSWPGNVRELKNLVERAVYRSHSSLITEIEFDPFRTPFADHGLPKEEGPQGETKKSSIEGLLDKPLNEAVRELEIHLLSKALKQAKYNQNRAAQILGLTYHQFRGVYRKYNKDIK